MGEGAHHGANCFLTLAFISFQVYGSKASMCKSKRHCSPVPLHSILTACACVCLGETCHFRVMSFLLPASKVVR